MVRGHRSARRPASRRRRSPSDRRSSHGSHRAEPLLLEVPDVVLSVPSSPFRPLRSERSSAALFTALLAVAPVAAQTNWSNNLSPTARPTANDSFAIAAADPSPFAPQGLILCFGGFDGVRLTNETWVFDMQSSTWAQVASGPRPSPREGHALAYDPLVNAFVLHGGRQTSVVGAIGRGNQVLNDTWQFNVSNFTWQQLSAQNGGITPPLHDHAMVFDRRRGQMLVFGGHQNTVNGPLLGDEMWLFRNYTGVNQHAWRLDLTGTNSPFGRAKHGMAYDQNRRRVVMYGGLLGPNLTPTAEFLEYDSSQFGFSAWTNVTATAQPALSPVRGPQMAYDVARGRVMFFGNEGVNGAATVREYDGTSWFTRNQGIALRPNGAGFAYDPVSRRSLFYGGFLVNQTRTYGPTTVSDLRSYGFGCGGGGSVPSLNGRNGLELQIGTSRDVVVGNLAANHPFGTVGVSVLAANPPVPLGGGCQVLLDSSFVTLPTFFTGGANAVSVALNSIPNDPAFLGSKLFFQALLFDTNPANPLGLVLSNGLDTTVGSL
ncbi:MAG: kelch repeat-containing protein [Planctomycetota bacterium]|jgi:hypothetical protein